jgi:hypothetical protein
MDTKTSLAVSIGALGGVATYLFLGPFAGLALSIWAAFLGWASYYHCGGRTEGLISSVSGNIWGAIMGGLTMIALHSTGLSSTFGVPIGAGICVAVGVFVMVLGSRIPQLSSVPAAVYGYAATVALTLLAQKTGTLATISMENPIVTISLSMLAGGIFGYISEQFAGALAKN